MLRLNRLKEAGSKGGHASTKKKREQLEAQLKVLAKKAVAPLIIEKPRIRKQIPSDDSYAGYRIQK
jgi:hypothetical protein